MKDEKPYTPKTEWCRLVQDLCDGKIDIGTFNDEVDRLRREEHKINYDSKVAEFADLFDADIDVIEEESGAECNG